MRGVLVGAACGDFCSVGTQDCGEVPCNLEEVDEGALNLMVTLLDECEAEALRL